MKKLSFFVVAFCAIVLALGSASCKKDNKQNAGERMVLGADINQGGNGGSKTYVGDMLPSGEYPVLWAKGDKFDLFSEEGTTPETFTINDASAGNTSAKFDGLNPGGSKYFGFYPSGAGTRVENTFTYSVLSAQAGESSNAPMVGYCSDGANVTFENVMSWVKIGLKGSGSVSSVKLHNKANTSLAGTLTVSFDAGGNITGTVLGGASTLTVTKDLTLTDELQYVSFLVPESTATEWIFTVNVGGTDKSFKKIITGGIERNAVYVGSIDVANDETYDVPAEALSEKTFTIANGKKVYFSQGNLWYDKSPEAGKPYWGFEANQCDYHTYPNYIAVLDGTETKTPADIYGLFGYGDVPADGNNIKTTKTNTSYSWTVDWGTKIGDGKWFTPAKADWDALINKSRMKNYSSAYYLTPKGGFKIGEKLYFGLFLFPDDYDGNPALVNGQVTWNEINAAGIVFLPCNGYRNVAAVSSYAYSGNPNKGFGQYWASNAYWLQAHNELRSVQVTTQSAEKYIGKPVRLVYEAPANQ